MKRRLILAGIAAACLSVSNVEAQTMVALTNGGQIFVINDVNIPGTVGTKMPVVADSGQTIVSIDTRPATGELYGLGYDPNTNKAQLYVVNSLSGATTTIGTPVMMDLGSHTTSISMDFNPAVDKVRVISENGNNYRLDPVTGAIVATDDTLSFAPGDVNSGIKPHIGAIAYTNSYVGSNVTELYNFDERLNVITRQDPPNAGLLNTINSTGLFLDTINSTVGMDIYFNPTTLGNVAYIAVNDTTGFKDTLYTIDLNTGMASTIGLIGNGEDVRDIAVMIDRSFQPVTGQMIYALQKGTNNIFNFDSDNAGTIRSYMSVTGLTAGHTLVGMDFRPSTRELYALGYDNAASKAQLYLVDYGTAAATAVGMPINVNLGTGERVGFDFNPATDRIRVVSADNGANLSISPSSGAIEATDANLTYASSDVSAGSKANIGSIGYTSYSPASSSSMLFGIDDSLGALVTIAPVDAGTVNTAAAAFVNLNPADMSSDIDFFYDSTTASDIAYMTFNTGTDVNDQLFTYTVAGGLASAGNIGLGVAVADIAALPKYRTPAPTSVKEVSKNRDLTAYPNPTNSELHITGKDVNGAKASVYDMSGKLIYSQGIKGNTLDVSNLPAGNYILNISAKNVALGALSFVKQ